MLHVFIVASKGIPAKYGGFETFVENLTARRRSPEIQYHVSCMLGEEQHFPYNGADCFGVRVPLPGAVGRMLHVSRALKQVETWAKAHPGEETIVYILGCRIGPLLGGHARRLHRLGALVWCNPDGLEWKRAKWSAPVRLFLRYCEKCLVEKSDFVVCDSMTIQSHLLESYPGKKGATTYIAYGAELAHSTCGEEKLQTWYGRHGLSKGSYFLAVGRFVPENNLEAMIREFMNSGSKRDLVLITNAERNRFYRTIAARTGFQADARVKFVGTIYDPELLAAVRENACGYLHGHSVGGTNPSLLEALASTRLNLLLDVGFNREVASDGAMYWTLDEGSLSALIQSAEEMTEMEIARLAGIAKRRIEEKYNWPHIVAQYEAAFLDALDDNAGARVEAAPGTVRASGRSVL